jgi:hypothetical protein
MVQDTRNQYGVAHKAFEGVYLSISFFMIGKGKAIPLQALTGLEGSRRLRLPDFKTVGT